MEKCTGCIFFQSLVKPPLADIKAWTLLGILLMHVWTVSCIFGWWFHTWIIFSMSLVFVVITSFEISFFNSAQTFSIGFMSGELPGQGNRGIFSFSKKAFIDFAVWHGAPSCINTKGCPLGNHSLSWGNSLVFSTSLYWSCRIVPWTTYRRPVPLLLITDQTITLVGCFTVCLTQSEWYFSPGRLRTYWALFAKISNVLSSLKQTYKN